MDVSTRLIADVPQGQGKALLDLGGLTYISSSGLRVLMLASKKVRAMEGAIAVAALQPVVMEVFEISRFDKVFKVYGSVGEALDALSAEASAAYGGE